MNPWDKRDGEPSLWFGRFTAYRLAGPKRSILGAVNAERANKGEQRRIESIPGAWTRISDEWQWKERAEAWDAAILDEQRAEAESAYKGELLAHRERAAKVAQASLAAGIRALNLADRRLQTLRVEEVPPGAVGSLLRAAAAVADAALNAEAHALAVEQLMRMVERGDSNGG